MTTIAFFFNRIELDILRKREDFYSLRLIALTPDADFYANTLGIQYKTIEDYYDEKELNILGNNSLQKVQEICDSIDSYFFNSEKFFSCSDIYMFIKLIYDQLLINHTFCSQILKKEKPIKVVLFKAVRLSHEIIVQNNDDLLINFLHYFFKKKYSIESEVLDHLRTKNKFNLKKIPIRKFLSNLKFYIIRKLKRYKNRKKPAIFILQHYDFETCKKLQDYFKVYWVIDYIDNISIKCFPQKILDYSKEYHFLHYLFMFDNICYFDLIQPKIDFVINFVSKKFHNITKDFYDFFVKKNIKAVISSSGQSLNILAGIKAAKLNKIPVIWGQHGGFYGYAEFPVQDFLCKNYTYYFLYTKDIGIINNYKNCFEVLDSKLLRLYYAKRNPSN